jgi:hypothetical protein
VPRCLGERAQLQAELEQKQQEAEKRDAMYEEELREQQDLAQAMKTRVGADSVSMGMAGLGW